MKVIVMTAFVCMVSLLAYGQEGIRWTNAQQLTWEDFTGKVNDTSKYDAECFAEIRYQYRFFNPNNFEFEVYANFDKNSSWRRKEMQSDELLKHEQMHFNIAELFAEKLKDDFENFFYTSDYSEQIVSLFNKRKLEYQAMQQQYDDETNHSLNKEKQKEWEDFITAELRKIKLDLQFVETDKPASREGI